MKKITENLIKFLNWSISFFNRKKKVTKVATKHTHIEPDKPRKTFGKGRAFKNNLKATKGRLIQRIEISPNSYRYIYHSTF